VELFGHVREAGFVTTEYFGSGALFRIEVPPLPEREITLSRPEWIEGELCGIGTKVLRQAVAGRTRFVGPGAIYAMNPCSQDVVFSAIDANTSRTIKIVELVKPAARLTEGEDPDEEPDYEEEEGEHVS